MVEIGLTGSQTLQTMFQKLQNAKKAIFGSGHDNNHKIIYKTAIGKDTKVYTREGYSYKQATIWIMNLFESVFGIH